MVVRWTPLDFLRTQLWLEITDAVLDGNCDVALKVLGTDPGNRDIALDGSLCLKCREVLVL